MFGFVLLAGCGGGGGSGSGGNGSSSTPIALYAYGDVSGFGSGNGNLTINPVNTQGFVSASSQGPQTNVGPGADILISVSGARYLYVSNPNGGTNNVISYRNVEDLVLFGRSRWNIENETNNILKTQGDNLEHDVGHGERFLANTLPPPQHPELPVAHRPGVLGSGLPDGPLPDASLASLPTDDPPDPLPPLRVRRPDDGGDPLSGRSALPAYPRHTLARPRRRYLNGRERMETVTGSRPPGASREGACDPTIRDQARQGGRSSSVPDHCPGTSSLRLFSSLRIVDPNTLAPHSPGTIPSSGSRFDKVFYRENETLPLFARYVELLIACLPA